MSMSMRCIVELEVNVLSLGHSDCIALIICNYPLLFHHHRLLTGHQVQLLWHLALLYSLSCFQVNIFMIEKKAVDCK